MEQLNLCIEEWRDIKGYEGRYQVSNRGNVRSIDHYGKHGKGDALQFVRGRALTPYKNHKGYLKVKLRNLDGTKKGVRVSRLVASSFIPNPDGLPEVNHKNFDKEDNSVGNLEWVTGSQNIEHYCKRGRAKSE